MIRGPGNYEMSLRARETIGSLCVRAARAEAMWELIHTCAMCALAYIIAPPRIEVWIYMLINERDRLDVVWCMPQARTVRIESDSAEFER